MNNVNTKKVNILIDKIADVREFNSKAIKYNNVDLVSNKYRVPINSLMGIFSLDIANPIKMEYPAELHDEIINDFGKWIVD